MRVHAAFATIAATTAAASLAVGAPAHAQTELPLPPGTQVISGAPQWIKIDTRAVTPQLLRHSFDVAALRGRFRAFRVEADHGTVEIARTEVQFDADSPVVDNSFSILKPKGETHVIRFGGNERTVKTLSLISATAARRSHTGRITLYGLHVPDIIVPPLPKRGALPQVQSAARTAQE